MIARTVSLQLLSQPQQIERSINTNLFDQIDDIKSANLNQFLRIIALVQKYYMKCNNLERIRATILIVKELDNGHL